MIDYRKIETQAELDEIKREGGTTDQLRELCVGAETWFIKTDQGSGRMSRWPNGRGAVCFGGDSLWGDWIERDGQQVLLLDEGGEVVDEQGQIVTVDA
jgi:hypothetical protein